MKSGFKPYKWHSHKDYDALKSFGSLPPAQFPTSFDIDAKIWVPNQEEPQGFPGIPNTPPLPEGCTDYAQTDLCMDEDLVQLDPMLLENVTHANANGGADIKVALAATIAVFNRTAYFNIKRTAGLDWYDSLRLVMLSTPEEKRAVSIGIPWYVSFETPNNGVLPQFSSGETFTWHNAVVSGWDARGLKIKSWQGPQYGEKGFVYMPRALVNQLLDIPGSCAFTLSKMAPHQVVTIKDAMTYVQWFVSLLLNLFSKASPSPVIAPVTQNSAITAPQPSKVENQPVDSPQSQISPKYDWSTPETARHSLRVICDEEGLTVEQKNLMSQVVHCESGYLTHATHPNLIAGKVVSTDYGICQWNDHYHAKEITPDEAINNPEKAVRLMCHYVKAGHINQWVCFSSGLFHNYSA